MNATEEEHTGRRGCGFGPACNKSGSTGTVHDKPDHATGGKKAARRDGFQCRNNALPEAGYYESKKLEEENKLLRAKTETLENAKDTKEMYANVLKAMAKYNGVDEDEATDYEF